MSMLLNPYRFGAAPPPPFNGAALARLSLGFSGDLANASGTNDYVWTNTILDSGWGFAGSTANIVIPSGVTLIRYSFAVRATAYSSLVDTATIVSLNGVDVSIRTKDGDYWLPNMEYGLLKVAAGDVFKLRRYVSGGGGPTTQANATQLDITGF